MRLFGLFVGSWALGVASYWVVGSVLAARLMGSGDLSAAALYSGVMFAITAPVIYLPALWWVKHHASKRSVVLFLTGVTLVHSVIATALVFAAFGGFRLGSLVKSEAFLFYVIFGIAGAALGVGYMSWFQTRAT